MSKEPYESASTILAKHVLREQAKAIDAEILGRALPLSISHDYAHCDNIDCEDTATCRRYHLSLDDRLKAKQGVPMRCSYLLPEIQPNNKEECKYYWPTIEFDTVELTPKRHTVEDEIVYYNEDATT
jgi:hypothetical protein